MAVASNGILYLFYIHFCFYYIAVCYISGSTKKETIHIIRFHPQNQNSHACLNISFQPFSDAKLEDQTGFLTPPSKYEARTIVEDTLGNTEASASPPEEADKDQTSKESKKEQDDEEENQPNTLNEASGGSSDENNCDEVGRNDLKRKSIFNFLQPPAKTKTSELDVYLSESLLENNSSVLYWKSAARFPQLQGVAKKLLAVPATSGGFDRLCPMAACIVRAKRNRLPPHTTERLLLYKNSLKTKTVKKSSGAAKH